MNLLSKEVQSDIAFTVNLKFNYIDTQSMSLKFCKVNTVKRNSYWNWSSAECSVDKVEAASVWKHFSFIHLIQYET